MSSQCLIVLAFASLAMLPCLSGCGRSPSSASVDEVITRNGVVYIPIDNTAFLIPQKTWLTGFSRNATDGTVGHIGLHATVPDVQPWSKARHEEMYWPAGPGKKLEIHVYSDRADQAQFFHHFPESVFHNSEFIEEPSDQVAQGLRRFRKLWSYFKDKRDEENALRQFGSESVENSRRIAGTPMMDTVFYELVENERVKYFIHCTENRDALFQDCHLLFPWSRTLMVDVTFQRDYIPDIVAMADKLSAKLHEFEKAGLAQRTATRHKN